MMRELSDKQNQCFGEDVTSVYTSFPNRINSVSRRELHQIIRFHLDSRKPVLVGFQRKNGIGHSVVAIGYRRESWNRLRLFAWIQHERFLICRYGTTLLTLTIYQMMMIQ